MRNGWIAAAVFAGTVSGATPGAWAQASSAQASPAQAPVARIVPTTPPPPLTTVEPPASDRTPDHTPGSIGFWIDNDLFGGGTDRYYTNGFQFYYVSGERPTYGAIDWMANLLPWVQPGGTRRYGFAFGQNMYTPSDITKPVPLPTERPYAGWLYGRASVVAEAPRQVDRIDLDLGIVGPGSLAEQTQKAVHKLVPGARTPRGWDYQLHNEPGVVLSLEHVWRSEQPGRLGPFEADFSPHAAGSVGNVLTYAAFGGTVRLGHNMPAPVGALILRPTASIPYQDVAPLPEGASWSWYVFAGAEGRAIARNIFLDGNSFVSSRSVHKYPLVAAFQLGATVRFGRYGLTYAQNFLTPEARGQKSFSDYGSIRLSIQF